MVGTASEYTLRQILYKQSGGGVWDQDGVSQILEFGRAQNEMTTIYTVPAGKTLYLTSLYFSGDNTYTTILSGGVVIFDATPAGVAEFRLPIAADDVNQFAFSFPTPLKLGAGWSVRIWSDNDYVIVHGQITGYELPE